MSNETEAPANEGNGTGLKVDSVLRAPSISIGGGSPSKIQADLDSPGPDTDNLWSEKH